MGSHKKRNRGANLVQSPKSIAPTTGPIEPPDVSNSTRRPKKYPVERWEFWATLVLVVVWAVSFVCDYKLPDALTTVTSINKSLIPVRESVEKRFSELLRLARVEAVAGSKLQTDGEQPIEEQTRLAWNSRNYRDVWTRYQRIRIEYLAHNLELMDNVAGTLALEFDRSVAPLLASSKAKIDRARTSDSVALVIYRHPIYLGETATEFKDIHGTVVDADKMPYVEAVQISEDLGSAEDRIRDMGNKFTAEVTSKSLRWRKVKYGLLGASALFAAIVAYNKMGRARER